jgi:hypothetical protein
MAKKRVPSLIVEFASDSGNLYYLSVLEYRRENYLVVIDNISEEEIGAYVLDFAQQERLDVRQILSVVTQWFYRGSGQYPLSFEFSRLGITPMTNRIYKTFELAHVTRLIGNNFNYALESAPKVRRRRVNLIPAGTEIRLKRSSEDRKALDLLQQAISQEGTAGGASSATILPMPRPALASCDVE